MATQGMFDLFGATPEEIRAKYRQGLMGTPISDVPLMNRPAAMGAGLGRQFGYALGRMLGGTVPGEAEAEARQQALTQAQAEGATGSSLYQALARQLSAAGDTRGAFMAAEKAREMAQQEEAAQVGLALKKAQLEEAQAKAKADPRVARAQELLKTGKYTPESVALFQQTGNANNLQFKGAEKTKIEKLLDAAGITVENGKGAERIKAINAAIERETKGDPAQLAQLKLLKAQTEAQTAQVTLQLAQAKIQQGQQADELRIATSKAATGRLLGTVDGAIALVQADQKRKIPLATGLSGQVSRGIEASPAGILNAQFDVIKANLGFWELQSMRDASKTGGALGSITERELALLQSTIDRVSTGLPAAENLAALQQIKKSIQVLSRIRQQVVGGDLKSYEWINEYYPQGQPEPTGTQGTAASGTVQTPAAPAAAGRKSLSDFNKKPK